MDKDTAFDRLKTAATTGRRSSLYLWMMRNRDRFSETLADAGRPNWDALAATFTEMGLENRFSGHGLTGVGVRLTWRKVKQAWAKAPIKQTAASPAAPIFEPATMLDPAVDEPDEFEFHDLKGNPV